MWEFIKNNIGLTIGVAVVAIAALLYAILFSGSTAPLLSSTGGAGSLPVSQSLVVTLNSLHTIKLDNSIFSDPVFISLNNFGVVIPQEPYGRQDPFIPFSASGNVSVSTSTGANTPVH